MKAMSHRKTASLRLSSRVFILSEEVISSFSLIDASILKARVIALCSVKSFLCEQSFCV